MTTNPPPAAAGGASAAAVVQWLAACAGGPVEHSWLDAALRATLPGEPRPALTAVVRVGAGAGDLGDLGDLLTCLAAQDVDGSELEIVVAAGDPAAAGAVLGDFAGDFAARCRIVEGPGDVTDAGLRAAAGSYLSIVEPGQLLTADWSRRFVEGARLHPGSVLRVQGFRRVTVAGPGGGPMTLSRTTPAAPMPFELGRHLRENQMGPATFAVPAPICRPGGVWYGATPGRAADWAFATQAAMVAGVVDLDHRTVISTRPASAPHEALTTADLAAALAGTPLVAEPQAAQSVLRRLVAEDPQADTAVALQIGALVDQVRMLQDQAADLYAEMGRLRSAVAATEAARDSFRAAYEEISRSEFWRVTAPARVTLGLARKARRRVGAAKPSPGADPS
jgi:hypothetical protein